VVVVSFTNNTLAFKEWFDFVIPPRYEDKVELFMDPERKLYQVLGFNYQFALKNLKEEEKPAFMDKMKSEQQHIWPLNMVKFYSMSQNSHSENKNFESTEGDESYVFRKFIDGDNPLQQGGDAVFDANWKLIKVFPMLHVADRVSVDDLLNC